MARRLRDLAIQVEYREETNKKRLESLATMVEYTLSQNSKQVRNLAIMFEYNGTPVIISLDYGPKLWVM
jgi:hypothetical protein